MKWVIAGSRTVLDYEFLCGVIKLTNLGMMDEIISGRAKGVDQLGERYAKDHNISCKLFPADWEEYGRAAGPIRNKLMRDHGDALLAIRDKDSKGTGTMDMVNQMLKAKKPVVVYFVMLDSDGKVLHSHKQIDTRRHRDVGSSSKV
jgi:hypothetical protein